MAKVRQRFRTGDRVVLGDDALENYGREHEGKVFVVEHASTKYMPATRFFAEGKPAGYHPGFDDASGSALYDLKGFGSSLYDWELERAPASRDRARTARKSTSRKTATRETAKKRSRRDPEWAFRPARSYTVEVSGLSALQANEVVNLMSEHVPSRAAEIETFETVGGKRRSVGKTYGGRRGGR